MGVARDATREACRYLGLRVTRRNEQASYKLNVLVFVERISSTL